MRTLWHCQGTLRRFHPFRHFRPPYTFITFPCLYSASPSLNNTPSSPSISAYFRFSSFTLAFTFHYRFIHCSLSIVMLFIVLSFIVLVTCSIRGSQSGRFWAGSDSV